jgi:hypothetical protein
MKAIFFLLIAFSAPSTTLETPLPTRVSADGSRRSPPGSESRKRGKTPIRVTLSPSATTVPTSRTTTFTATVEGTKDTAVIWSVQEGKGCGTVTEAGIYKPPSSPAICHVVATSHADPTVTATADISVTSCWSLQAVNRVRFFPRAGRAADMVGGTIQGSNTSPTNGFEVLATVSAEPVDGDWTDLSFANTTPYRYIKYYGPAGSYGQIAEIEFYSNDNRLTGDGLGGFGTAGSRSGNPWQNALDGNPDTFFDGSTPDDVYVGIDAASGYAVAAPIYSPAPGAYSSAQSVAISSATSRSSTRYTTNGSDPVTEGIPYTGPVVITSTATLSAVATKSCMLQSPVTSGLYTIGKSGAAQSSLHIGNSLTDSIDGYLLPLAIAGGIPLDYWHYTVPGAGTYVYQNFPTGGFGGIPNIQTEVRTRPYNHISMQPFPNMPCVPTGHDTEGDAVNRSDAININDVWNDATQVNPDVQLWLYFVWPAPADYGPGSANCMTGGWNRDPKIWNPTRSTSWEDAVSIYARYNEAVRSGLIELHPNRRAPSIVPAGLALVNLKHAVEAGSFPEIATNGFWNLVFEGGSDLHLTNEGRYLVALVFYASMFQLSPDGLPHPGTKLTDAQAAALQIIAWQTVVEYSSRGNKR